VNRVNTNESLIPKIPSFNDLKSSLNTKRSFDSIIPLG